MGLGRELTDLGLSPKEAKVYLSLLALGTASAQAIARHADIVRPTTYVILETLTRKGLASKVTGPDARKMLFAAEAPERLEIFLQQQEHEVERRKQSLSRLLPDLRSQHLRGEERPRVRLFEGKEGLRALQQEFVGTSKEPVVGMAPEDEMYGLFPPDEYDRDIRGVRVRLGVRSRHITISSRGSRSTVEEDAAALRESRYLLPHQLPLKASFAAHGSLLSIVSFKSRIIGVLIEHPDIAGSFRAIFEYVWGAAGKASVPEEPPGTPPA